MNFRSAHALRRVRWTVAAAGAALILGAGPALAIGSEVPDQSWGTNGRVSFILPDQDRVYIGGSFSAVTDLSGNSYPANNLAVFLPATGQFDLTWKPTTDDEVLAMAKIGDQLYIGGRFKQADGWPRKFLASISASTGAISPKWRPQPDRLVEALAAVNGQVYAGGYFTSITDGSGLHSRTYAARLTADDGTLVQSWAPTLDARVRAVQGSADGSHVFLGGDFTVVNGSNRVSRVASVFSESGELDEAFVSGSNNLNTRSPVFDLATDGTRLFEGVGGSGGACTVVDAVTGSQVWSKHTNGNVQSVAVVNGTVYCGGHFGGAGAFDGQVRYKLAAVDLASGSTLAWAPRYNSPLGVWIVRADSGRLYVGGDFTKVSGKPRPHFATYTNP